MFDKKLTEEDIIKNSWGWTPSRYRAFISHTPEDSSKHRLLSPDNKTRPFRAKN